MEGLSEYLSVPGVDAHTEMWLRDATLEGRLPTLEELAYVGDIRVYRFGQSIVALIAEQFGDEMLGPWLRGMARRRSFERGTSEVLGVTVRASLAGLAHRAAAPLSPRGRRAPALR